MALVLLSGCGQAPTDNEFVPLVDEFNALIVARGLPAASVPVAFGETHGSLGVCTRSAFGGNEVTIDREWWNLCSPAAKRLLIFHELGHCVLGRAHRDDVDEGGHPVSIMNSRASILAADFESRKEALEHELLFGAF